MGHYLMLSLKPVWLLGCGTGLGLAMLLALWGVAAVLHRRAAAAMLDVALEPVVWPALAVAAVLVTFTLVASVLDKTADMRFFDQKKAAWTSILRLPFVGEQKIRKEVPPHTAKLPIFVHVPEGELGTLKMAADRQLVVTVNEPDSIKKTIDDRFRLTANDPFEWVAGRDPIGPLAGQINAFYVANDGDGVAILNLDIVTRAVVPEAAIIPATAAGLVGYVGFFLLLQWWFPKVSAVALATAREGIAQPLFYLILVAGAVFLFALLYTPFFTFGEDVKQYMEGGLTLLKVISILFAVWTASVSISDEIEGRTALTVLSKPISRRQFILGKYIGIISAVAVIFVVLGALFMTFVSYRVVCDAWESGDRNAVWHGCYTNMARVAPGLVLAFMETAVLASISVAISTRLPMLPNLILCTTVYVIGHLVPLLVSSTSAVGHSEIVQFMGRLFGTILPVLDHYDIYAAVAKSEGVPLVYLAWAALLTVIYVAVWLLLALAMFEDRDLA